MVDSGNFGALLKLEQDDLSTKSSNYHPGSSKISDLSTKSSNYHPGSSKISAWEDFI
jgi:hypothetical protein